MSIAPKAGGTPMEDAGKYLVILQRQPDGGWKVTRDIDNSSRPLPPGVGIRIGNE
jgi:ketosteroid isomerase-like protein